MLSYLISAVGLRLVGVKEKEKRMLLSKIGQNNR